MKIEGLPRRMQALEKARENVGEAVVSANVVVGEAQQGLANARVDAQDKTMRREVPVLGGLATRLEDFDKAYSRIANARQSDLSAATHTASKLVGLQTQLANLVSYVSALTDKPASELTLFEAFNDARTAQAVLTSIQYVRAALQSAKESPVAQGFPMRQLDAIETSVKGGLEELKKLSPAVTTGNFKPNEVVDAAAQKLLSTLDATIAGARKGEATSALDFAAARAAWIQTGQDAGPQFDQYFTYNKQLIAQHGINTGYLTQEAVRRGRPLTIEETLETLQKTNQQPHQYALLFAVTKELGGADLVAATTKLNVRFDIADPRGQQLVQMMAQGNEAAEVLQGLTKRLAQAPGGRLTFDDVVDFARTAKLPEATRHNIDRLAATDPISFNGLLPESLRGPYQALADLRTAMTQGRNEGANPAQELQKAKAVFDARLAEIAATATRQRAEGNLDTTAIRGAYHEAQGDYQASLDKIQSDIVALLPDVGAKATEIQKQIGHVVEAAFSAISAVDTKAHPALASLRQTLAQTEASLRSGGHNMEAARLTELTRTLTSLPQYRASAEQTVARYLAPLG